MPYELELHSNNQIECKSLPAVAYQQSSDRNNVPLGNFEEDGQSFLELFVLPIRLNFQNKLVMEEFHSKADAN